MKDLPHVRPPVRTKLILFTPSPSTISQSCIPLELSPPLIKLLGLLHLAVISTQHLL